MPWCIIWQTFTGVPDGSAVHSLMIRWRFVATAAIFVCGFSLFAQEAQRQPVHPALNQDRKALNHDTNAFSLTGTRSRFSSLTLSDRQFFSLWTDYDALEAMVPDFLPALGEKEPGKMRASSKREFDDAVAVRPKVFDHISGEVGVLYGHSLSGKFSRELERGYIFGEMGNDKTQISLGAFYERSTGQTSSPRR